MNGETELQNPAPSEVPKASGSLDEIVRPIVVTITRADHMRVRSMAEYHARIANKIQAAGIPLGPMVRAILDGRKTQMRQFDSDPRLPLSRGKKCSKSVAIDAEDGRKVWIFEVMGEPKGQPRQRHFARKIGNTYVARAYTPGTAEAWKTEIALAAKKEGLDGKLLDGPIRVTAFFWFQRPKSHFGSGKNSAVLKQSAPRAHTKKPDVDNVVKALFDALTQVGVWRDDAQVAAAMFHKGWSTGMGSTSLTVEII